MSNFKYLNRIANSYYVNKPALFSPIGTLNPDLVEEIFDFAYQMTFGRKGEHRSYRAGGTHQRRNGEIFANTFQGKLAEYALFCALTSLGIDVDKPDLSVFGLGEWDTVDLMIGNKSVSVKSTKSFGNLLLLEERDWDNQANYIPNGDGYDYTFLIRMSPFCEDIMRKNRCLYSDSITEANLKQTVLAENWTYDIPGYVTREDLIQIINGGFILPRGSMLNGKIRMDASNYYIQAGDMRNLSSFTK